MTASFPHLPVTDFTGCTQNFEKLLPVLTASAEPGVRGRSRGVEDTGWIAPALLNSWANKGGGYIIAGYRKQGNTVRLRGGFAHSGATGSEAFTLPTAFRPTADSRFVGSVAGSLACQVTVAAVGSVVIFYPGVPEYISIDGITFTVD